MEGFDGRTPTCRVSAAPATSNARIRTHERSPKTQHSGAAAELVWVDAAGPGSQLFVELDVPPALVFDDLTASVWVRPSRPGARFGLRIVFPEQIDTRTGQPLTADFLGDVCLDVYRWQQLTCRTSNDEVRKLLTRLRAQLGRALGTPNLNTQGMYVDRMVLVQDLESGSFEFYVDDLSVGPVIDPRANGAQVVTPSVAQPQVVAPVTVGDDRLLRDGRPFFALIAPYHGESTDLFRKTGVNIAWTQDFADAAVQQALAEIGLAVMATPPAANVLPAEGEAGVRGASYSVGLPTIGSEASNVLMWNVGSMLKTAALPGLRATVAAVQDADPYRRPVFADVVESEREFHRSVDVLSFSKHTLHTSTSPLDFARFLELKSLQALRGKPTATYIQTEVSPANLENRPADAARPVVEPEQIWMQVYATLGAGMKAIGYWKHTPFDADLPGSAERVHAITLANLQIHVLHRWLATGKVVDNAPVRIGDGGAKGQNALGRSLFSGWNPLAGNEPHPVAAQIRAPVIQCQAGWLVLPHYLEHGGQHQPGPMRVQNLAIFLRGVDGYQAWEVTTTGVHPYQLATEPVAGGTEIRLRDFDQFAAIVITNDAAVLDELKRDCAAVREAAGDAWVALAAAKLERVQRVHDELHQLGAKPVPNADVVLAEARRDLKTAQSGLESQDFDGARIAARRVLRLTRQVQRAHWENACQLVYAPTSTPYSICFQTLPDFYRFVQQVAAARPTAQNILRGGDFEEWGTILATNWTCDVAPSNDTVRVAVALHPSGASGRALQLSAQAVDPQQPPAIVVDTPARFVTPPLPVFSGQIVRVRGKVWIEVPVTAHPDGLMLYDNLSGTVGALRWRADAPTGRWVPFELLRPVQHSGELQLTIELRGLGDVRFDELQVTPLDPPGRPGPAQ